MTRSAMLWRSQTRRDQLFFLVMGLVLLAISAGLQNKMSSARSDWNLVRAETPDSERTYRALAMNFPRLTMGGFRGVLSTVLWIQAEEDKNNRKWLDLGTKYNLIGTLQPYFTSVYVFHSWNLAYNLSAQWAEQDAKYKWILDGMAYLYKGEEYNPGNTDLIYEEANLYAMKLGGAYERAFYRQHWRDDISRLHEFNDRMPLTRDSAQALKHVRDFVQRPYFKTRMMADPAGNTEGVGWGVQITDPELFAKRTDNRKPGDPMEFRYGLSPFYFAYVEYKRSLAAGWTETAANQVVASRPAMSLRLWVRDDCYYMWQMMKEMFGTKPNPALLKSPAFGDKVADVELCFRNIQTIGPKTVDTFNEYLGVWGQVGFVETTHRKHILETQAIIEISRAEMKLFSTLVQWHVADRKMTPELVRSFQEADALYQAAYKPTIAWVDKMYPAVVGEQANPDRADSEKYANALLLRSKGIQALLTLPADQKPDMSFLEEEVVEK
jgi:hypothetical protein